MSMPAREPVPATLNGRGSGDGLGLPERPRSRMPMRVIVGALAAFVLFGTGVHLAPAIKAGMHDGTKGSWVATGRTCSKSTCIWNGKFVLADGRVAVASTQYSGQLPSTLKVGTTLPALDTGESGLVYPASGSDLWMSLLVAFVLSAALLYWAASRPLRDYLAKRRELVAADGALRPGGPAPGGLRRGGPVPRGPAPGGLRRGGPVPRSPAPDGPAPDGLRSGGRTPGGPAPGGPASDGPAAGSAGPDGPGAAGRGPGEPDAASP